MRKQFLAKLDNGNLHEITMNIFLIFENCYFCTMKWGDFLDLSWGCTVVMGCVIVWAEFHGWLLNPFSNWQGRQRIVPGGV